VRSEEVGSTVMEVGSGSEGESDLSCNSVWAWPLTQHSQASQQLSQPSQPTTQSQSEQVLVVSELVEGEEERDKEDNGMVGSSSDDEEDEEDEDEEDEGGGEDGRSVGASDMSAESGGWLCKTQQPPQRSDHQTAETAGSPVPQAATIHSCVPSQTTPLPDPNPRCSVSPALSFPCATVDSHSATVPCHTILIDCHQTALHHYYHQTCVTVGNRARVVGVGAGSGGGEWGEVRAHGDARTRSHVGRTPIHALLFLVTTPRVSGTTNATTPAHTKLSKHSKHSFGNVQEQALT
jgi:hypothetical protein